MKIRTGSQDGGHEAGMKTWGSASIQGSNENAETKPALGD